MTTPPHSLDQTLTSRLREVATGAAATEGELRLLTERGDGLARALAAGVRASESRLGSLAATPDAALAEMASELRRAERLREELDDLRADLAALERRARTLRGSWMQR